MAVITFNLFFCCRLQGFNVLVVTMASRGISLLSALGEELQVEGQIEDPEKEGLCGDDKFRVTSSYSAWQRVKKLMDDLPLLNLLFSQFHALYKMVCV